MQVYNQRIFDESYYKCVSENKQNKNKMQPNKTPNYTKNPPKQLNKSIREMERCIRNSSGIIFECFSTLVPIVLHELQLPALNLIVCHSSIQKLVQLLFFTAKSLMLM